MRWFQMMPMRMPEYPAPRQITLSGRRVWIGSSRISYADGGGLVVPMKGVSLCIVVSSKVIIPGAMFID